MQKIERDTHTAKYTQQLVDSQLTKVICQQVDSLQVGCL